MSTYSTRILGISGLVAYWRQGEPSGTSMADAKGTNTGTYTNGPTLGVAGAIVGDSDTAVKYVRASGTYATVPDATALHVGDTFSFETWIKRTSLAQIGWIVNKGATGGNSFAILFLSTNVWELADASTFTQIAVSTSTIADTTTWHHIVVTKSGSTIHLYQDGVDVTSVTANQTLTSSTSALTLATNSNGTSTNELDGALDDTTLYNVAISAATVSANYNAGITGSSGAPGEVTGTAAAGSPTIDLVPTTNTTGDTLILMSGNIGDAISSIANTGGGGTWAQVARSASNQYSEMWACSLTAGGVTLVTVTYATSTWARAVDLLVVTGLTGTPVDQHAVSTNPSSATIATGSITPTQSGEVIIAFATSESAFSSGPTNGFTALTPLAFGTDFLWPAYKIQGAAAPISTGWVSASATGYDTCIASFATGTIVAATTNNVYRGGVLRAANLSSKTYQDTGLTDGVQYSYQVSATLAGIEGPKSNIALVTPLAAGRTASSPIVVTTNNVTIANLSFSGPIDGTSQHGIYAVGSSGSHITNLTISNCSFSGFDSAIWVGFVDNVLIEDCWVDNAQYAGIMVLSAIGGSVVRNHVSKIGVPGYAWAGGNAYGIAISQQNPATDPQSTGVQVTDNTVSNIPTWHGLNTHGGINISFLRNTIIACRMGIFIANTADGNPNRSINPIVDNNNLIAQAVNPGYGIVCCYSTGGDITGNTITGWPSGQGILTNSGGDPASYAINLTIGANTISPP